MPEESQLAVARLIEVTLGDGDPEPVPDGVSTPVQFNPETLKLAYSNTVARPETAGSSAMQYIASSSTKLDVELWFDVTVEPDYDDVRKRAEGVYYFVTPKKAEDPTKFVVPGVRFHWGAFLFEGVVTTFSETLELFSADGRPLRSRITLSFASQNIKFRIEGLAQSASRGGVGQSPRTPVRQGDSVQQLAASSGRPGSWRDLAAANDVDNPRRPQVGSLMAPAPGRA